MAHDRSGHDRAVVTADTPSMCGATQTSGLTVVIMGAMYFFETVR